MAQSEVAQKKMVAGLLAILIGWTGAHKFYLGNTTTGIIQLVSNIACGAGAIIALIEGIMYLTKPDDVFEKTYIIDKKQWF
ncbi:TM2 domain-containing protein [Zavarzinella formosa]|uniref:TM2 domain-containing protein n=1 Tax=Zavarzinella formosa TaxID=360055 RepID=UPI0002E32CF3|nr:TM2 domain-containing protein [Zavarzinella formosa]